MSTIRMVILDFDGTIADTAAVIIKTTQATISELGLPSRTDEQCAAMIGLRLVEIPPVLFPECDIDGDLYAGTYRRLFHKFNTEGAVEVYPNVVETLKTLKAKGLILTIASSRSHASLAEYVESLGLSSLISLTLGADDVDKGKPDPEPVNRTLERFGLSPENVIVVGDTSFDIQMGKNAGTATCGVTYGNGSRESLRDADWLVDDFGKLLDIVSV
ncbi:MAG: HAD family hydrolase [Bacteroidales bacterium]|nr:HAD family hydrolase [Bacteroidales bacterium]